VSGATLLDLVLVFLLVTYGATGFRQGLVVSVLSLVGFLAGGTAGMGLLPAVLGRWEWAVGHEVGRILLLVFGVFVMASIGQALMVGLGSRLRARVRARPVRLLDSLLGAVAVVAAVAVLIWFVGGAVRGGAPAPLARAIGESRVLGAIDRVVPPETGGLFAGFRQMLDREGFPKVFQGIGAEPITPAEPPDPASAAGPQVRAAAESVVKVTGVAEACQRGQEGTGWVAAPERVVTNAHVVAGMTRPQVRAMGLGPAYPARIVVFDPRRDLAVLEVPGLRAPALSAPAGSALRPGDPALVAGFPLNGPYRLEPARVRQTLNATGSDIYGRPGVQREVYSLFTRVEPGNSGGPLLSPSGQVVGVVFAKSLDDVSTGYALTLAEARPVIDAAATASVPVDSGGCSVG